MYSMLCLGSTVVEHLTHNPTNAEKTVMSVCFVLSVRQLEIMFS
jgi:hypothetical protein